MLALAGCGGAQQEVTEEPVQETKQTTQEAPKLTGVAAELQNLMATKSKMEYQITYDVVAKAEGQEFKSTMIQYFDGVSRFRTDVTIKGMSEIRIYVIDGTGTSCAKANNKWVCSATQVQDDASKQAENSIAQGSARHAVTADGTKQLLGKTHNCYKAIDSAQEITMRYCFSADGVLVYNSAETSQVTTEMTALLYGKDVAETVWVIPT